MSICGLATINFCPFEGTISSMPFEGLKSFTNIYFSERFSSSIISGLRFKIHYCSIFPIRGIAAKVYKLRLGYE